jgi:hypothetical protein
MINVHYALQTCTRNRQAITSRYCGGTRKELSEKCITSFFLSIEECIKIQPGTCHYVNIIDDNSCIEHIEYLQYLVKYFNKGNLKVQLSSSSSSGIVETIKDCWNWLEQEGKQLVFQVQDDYLFEKNAIFEMIDVFLQIDNDLNTHPIVIPYNDPYLWNTTYKYNSTPRVIMPGKNRYWVQTYDISCTFLTSKIQFSKHWDMYDKFVTLGSNHSRVEVDSINRILVDRGVFGVMPIESIALHMQTELEKDPYIDWHARWNNIESIKYEKSL